MRNFSYYEAKKFLEDVSKKGIDINQFNLEEFYDAKELAELLDVSDSTANNWLNGRTDISKLGEQAISYQIMIDLLRAYKNTPKSNIMIETKDGNYEVYGSCNNGEYKLLAITGDIKIARTIKEINKLYKILEFCEDFISVELKTREGYDELVRPYSADLTNLRDLMKYISSGQTISELRDKMIKDASNELSQLLSDNSLPPVTFSADNTKVNENKDIITIAKQAARDMQGYDKLYDDVIPDGTLFRYIPMKTRDIKYRGIELYVKKISKGKYLTEKVKKYGREWIDYQDAFGQNNIGKIYQSLHSAYEAILYTRSKSLNETEETEFSTNDGKTWMPTGTLKMSNDEYITYNASKA